MAKIKHIALTTQDPDKAAAFYKEAFGLKEIRRSPDEAQYSSQMDTLAWPSSNWKTEKRVLGVVDAGMGLTPSGIHHFGFEVE